MKKNIEKIAQEDQEGRLIIKDSLKNKIIAFCISIAISIVAVYSIKNELLPDYPKSAYSIFGFILLVHVIGIKKLFHNQEIIFDKKTLSVYKGGSPLISFNMIKAIEIIEEWDPDSASTYKVQINSKEKIYPIRTGLDKLLAEDLASQLSKYAEKEVKFKKISS